MRPDEPAVEHVPVLRAALGSLLGIRPDLLDDLIARGIPVRVYTPFGDNWFRYWMRRLAESRGT